MKQQFYDINRLPNCGTIIIPLSMLALSGYQQASKVVEFIDFFKGKTDKITNDVVFLYTDGLYFNNNDSAYQLRKILLRQMYEHRNAIINEIDKRKDLVPGAFHFISWNQCILNTPNFFDYLIKMEKIASSNNLELLHCIKHDSQGRELTKENIRFILEEAVLTHLICQKMVSLPKKSSLENNWNLIAYPGNYLETSKFIYQNKILPVTDNNIYANAVYDINEKVLKTFEKVK